MKTIAVVTGTRSEYGILKPLLKKMNSNKRVKLELIVTGMHLLKDFGSTYQEIKRDGFVIKYRIPIYDQKNNDSQHYHARATSRGISSFSKILDEINPTFLLVLGDRLEVFSAVVAASLLSIPIVHIHGGDKTDSGHIDESIRHAISKFAHIHLTATASHSKRLEMMGEQKKRIFNVGALGIDSILDEELIPKNILFEEFGLDPNHKTIVCLFHPVILEFANMDKQIKTVLTSVKELGIQTVIIYPNNDRGSSKIIDEIDKYQQTKFIKIVPYLSHDKYINLLRHSDVLIGNSSSGIIETPTIKIPVVNIGTRNLGREHAKNVIFTDVHKQNIIHAIQHALTDRKFLNECKKCINPYGTGRASEQIINVLLKTQVTQSLLKKVMTNNIPDKR